MKKIDEVLHKIQEKWGHQAVQSARQLNDVEVFYSSGFLALDKLIQGLPQSQVTELTGRPSSGMTTLAYHSLIAAQKQQSNVLIIDSLNNLDMHTAASFGVSLEKLILVEVEELRLLMNLLPEILNSAVVDYLLLNLMGLSPQTLYLRPLVQMLHRSSCVVLMLLPQTVKTDIAALRLRIQRRKWLQMEDDIVGCLSSVYVDKNRSGKTGQECLLVLPFSGGIFA